MFKPHLYCKANKGQRFDAEEVINEYLKKINWHSQSHGSLIDVGSGTGDVLFDFIYPKLPENFQNIVCSDINPKMVNYAKQLYGLYRKTDFKVLNIESAEELPLELKGQFDLVTSFYTLHWIQNKRLAYQNIYKLLRPEGGDCLHVYLAHNLLVDVFRKLRESPKWFNYLKQIKSLTTVQPSCQDQKRELEQILKETQFSSYQVEIRKKIFIYESEQVFKDNMLALNTHLDSVPSSMHQDYMDDFIEAAINLGMLQDIKNGDRREFQVSYTMAIVFARK